MAGHKPAPNPWFVDHHPEIYMNMGLTAGAVQKRYGVTREDSDAFALRSHQNALKAQAEGRFADEIVPGETVSGRQADVSSIRTKALAPIPRLKRWRNSSPCSTRGHGDGGQFVADQRRRGGRAGHVGHESEGTWAEAEGPFRQLRHGGVPPEIMGIGPVVAIPKALALAGLKLEDIGVIELNEAFAVQALSVIRVGGLDPDKVNPNGGAIALGHPLGCTGAKLTATILREMERRDARYGMVTMCVGGGQGAAGILRCTGASCKSDAS